MSSSCIRYITETSVETPFLFLTLDIPPAPLFKDELEQNIIPQVPLSSLLSKFDGVTEKVRASMTHPYLLKVHQYIFFSH